MQHRDIAILGGGMAGSTAAAMLGPVGIDTVLIDRHDVCAFGFPCGKLDASQVHLLGKTGLVDAVNRVATRIAEVWIARRGRPAVGTGRR